MSAPFDVPRLQALLDASRRAWMPQTGEAWETFVRRKAPPEPALWHFSERSLHRKAMALALGKGQTRKACEAILIPFWVAENEDEEPRDDAWRRRLIAWSNGKMLLDIKLPDDASFWARITATRVRGAFVTLGRHYAPGILVDRFGSFAVTNGLVQLIVETIEATEDLVATAKPTRIAPAFSMIMEPAFDISEVPKDVAAAAAEIIRELQYVNEDEESGASESGDDDE
ncbi:MAG: hypothetical protein ABI461_00230 [Polyangiaceae bacterium]